MAFKDRPSSSKPQPKTAFALAMERALAEKSEKTDRTAEESTPARPKDAKHGHVNQDNSNRPSLPEQSTTPDKTIEQTLSPEQLAQSSKDLGKVATTAETVSADLSARNLGHITKQTVDAEMVLPIPFQHKFVNAIGQSFDSMADLMLAYPELHSHFTFNSLTEVSMEDFRRVRSPRDLDNDREYLIDLHKIQRNRPISKLHENEIKVAKRFEKTVLERIVDNQWLGQTKGNPEFYVCATQATEFDDKTRRIDGYATIVPNEKWQATDLAEPRVALDHDLILGFDATTGGRKADIVDKLTRMYSSGRTYTDFGYSEIKYYKAPNGTPIALPVTALRYVIGISNKDAENLERNKIPQMSNDYADAAFYKRMKNTYLEWTRFKVLTEISAQTDFYQAMLPKPTSSGIDLSSTARTELAYMKQISENALKRCTSEILKQKYHADLFSPKGQRNEYQQSCFEELERLQLQRHVLALIAMGRRYPGMHGTEYNKWGKAQFENGITAESLFDDKWQDARKIIEECLLTNAKSDYAKNHPNAASYNTADSFAQIVETTRELTKDARSGLLDRWKGPGQHNARLVKKGNIYVTRS